MSTIEPEHILQARRIANGPRLRWIRDEIGAEDVEGLALLGLVEFERLHDPEVAPFEVYVSLMLGNWVTSNAGSKYHHGCATRRPPGPGGRAVG